MSQSPKSALPSVAPSACLCPQEDRAYTRLTRSGFQRRLLLCSLLVGCMWISFRVTGDDLSTWLSSFLPSFDRESSQSSGSIKGEWVESRSYIETTPSIFIMVRITFSTLLVAFVGAVAAVGPAPDQIKNLVTFGDSYTDAVRPTHPSSYLFVFSTKLTI